MASGNDAAYALARVGGGAGGVPQTLRSMNARAAQLGAFDTVARDPCRAGPAGAEQQRLRPRPHRPGRDAAAGPAPLRHDQARRRSPAGRARTARRGGRSSSTTTTGCSTTTPAPSASRTATPSRRSRPSSARASRGGPHLPVHRDGRHQRQLAPDGGPAGLGVRPRHPPGTGGPARAAGQHRAAVRAGRRSSREPAPAVPVPEAARAPDPPRAATAAAPAGVTPSAPRRSRCRRSPGAPALARRRRTRRRGAAGAAGRQETDCRAPAAAGPPPQISSFCLICPLFPDNRLVVRSDSPTRDRVPSRLDDTPRPVRTRPTGTPVTTGTSTAHPDDPGPLTVAARSDPLLSGPSPCDVRAPCSACAVSGRAGRPPPRHAPASRPPSRPWRPAPHRRPAWCGRRPGRRTSGATSGRATGIGWRRRPHRHPGCLAGRPDVVGGPGGRQQVSRAMRLSQTSSPTTTRDEANSGLRLVPLTRRAPKQLQHREAHRRRAARPGGPGRASAAARRTGTAAAAMSRAGVDDDPDEEPGDA